MIVKCLTSLIPILHPHPHNLAHGQFNSLPRDEGKGSQETAQEQVPVEIAPGHFCLVPDREGCSVPRGFLFLPTFLPDGVKQSLKVNKCGKDKTNIFSNWIGSFLVWVQMRENQNVSITSAVAMK